MKLGNNLNRTQILVMLLLIVMNVGCTNIFSQSVIEMGVMGVIGKNLYSRGTSGEVVNASALQTRDISGATTLFQYGDASLEKISIVDEVNKIKNKDFSTLHKLLMLIQTQKANAIAYKLCMAQGHSATGCFLPVEDKNLGYALCMSSNRKEEDCAKAMGLNSIGFGLCMMAGRSVFDCNPAINKNNVGFGICMAAGRPAYECDDALDKDTFGFGICMAAGKNYPECAQALNVESLGFGVCMAATGNFGDCSSVIGFDSIGYAFCMSSAEGNYAECRNAFSAHNLGYGICMMAGKTFAECTPGLDSGSKERIGFGMCMASGKGYYDCHNSLNSENLGFGLCMTAGLDWSLCNNALDNDRTGFGICIAAGRSYAECSVALNDKNIGFGICMAAGKNFADCNDVLSQKAVEPGGCIASGKSPSECVNTIALDTSLDHSLFLATIDGDVKSINNLSIASTKQVQVALQLNIDPRLEGQIAQLYVVVGLPQANGSIQYFQKNGSGFNPWDLNFDTLKPSESNIYLTNFKKHSVFQGSLSGISGNVRLYYGYLLNGQKIKNLIYNQNREIKFTVY